MHAHSLFISDLHLDPSRDTIVALFEQFLQRLGPAADALYILGDLFEVWIGDDDLSPFNVRIMNALRTLSEHNTKIYFMHGNRDFLIGDDFAQRSGIELLTDPTVTELYGHRCLLMHGDTLCTQDIEYQTFRRTVRNPKWQSDILSKPLSERLELAKSLRAKSQEETKLKEAAIMDVDPNTVTTTLKTTPCDYLIHGHTHRMAKHNLEINNHKVTRIVLGDWYESGSYLRFDQSGPSFLSL